MMWQQYVIYGALFLTLLVGTYELITYVRENSVISGVSRQMLESMNKSEQQRAAKEKARKLLEGNLKKQKLLYRLDRLILQSGVRRFVPFFNTELLLFVLLFSVLLLEIYLEIRDTGILWRIFAPVLLVGGIRLLLILFTDRNFKKTESQLLSFMNLIGNYQQSCDDLLSIFGKISPYLEEPLKGAVEECFLYARMTGNVSAAFYELELRIPHEQFQRLIQNLEICYRHDANYGEIISDSREMLMDYLRNRRERQTMKNNARMEILLIIVCCCFAFWMMDGFMQQNLWYLLRSTMIGQILLGYCIGVLFLCGKLLFMADR